MDYKAAFRNAVEQVRDEGRYRVFADLKRHRGDFPRATWTRGDGSEREVIVWCSNDYLGQGQNPVVIDAMHAAIDANGTGSGGTRNISGTTHFHVELERELADLHGKESALLFTSGYVSNEATLATLYKILPGLIIFSDELNHASMISGIRNGGGKRVIFRHNDLAHLEELLAAADPDAPKLVAFESVYSMDGDISDIPGTVALAKKYGALTYIDEVHAVGLYGPRGGGVDCLPRSTDECITTRGKGVHWMKWMPLAVVLAALAGGTPAQAGMPYPEKMKCAVGGESFTHIGTMSYSTWGSRPDGKPYGSWRFPIELPVLSGQRPGHVPRVHQGRNCTAEATD